MPTLVRTRLEGEDNIVGHIRNVSKAEIEDGKVTFSGRTNELCFYEELIDKAWEFPILTNCDYTWEWSRIFLYCACQRAVCKALISKWDEEDQRKRWVEQYAKVYNSFSKSVARFDSVIPVFRNLRSSP